MYDGTQCATVQLLVIGDDQLGERLVSPKNHMTTVLPALHKSCLDKRLHALPTGDPRK